MNQPQSQLDATKPQDKQLPVVCALAPTVCFQTGFVTKQCFYTIVAQKRRKAIERMIIERVME